MAKKNNTPICCYDCTHAYLMRSYPMNPVIAKCQETGERNIASTLHYCERHEKRTNTPTINAMVYV